MAGCGGEGEATSCEIVSYLPACLERMRCGGWVRTVVVNKHVLRVLISNPMSRGSVFQRHCLRLWLVAFACTGPFLIHLGS